MIMPVWLKRMPALLASVRSPKGWRRRFRVRYGAKKLTANCQAAPQSVEGTRIGILAGSSPRYGPFLSAKSRNKRTRRRRRVAAKGHGAWKIATTKRPDRTLVIDADEHLSYLEPAAALSGVRSMHCSSVYHRARQGPREPIPAGLVGWARPDPEKRLR